MFTRLRDKFRSPQEAAMEIDLLLVTVTEVETKSVFAVFREATGQEAKPIPVADKVFHDLGTINGTRAWLVQSEMGAGGLGAAQQTVQKGIEAVSPSAVIMVGIAFGVNEKKQEIGDILISRQLVPYDFQKVATSVQGRRIERNFILRDDRPHCSGWLFDTFRGAAHYWKGQTIHVGQVLTGEKLIDNLDYREELVELAPEAIGGEMEGRGLYVACQDKKVDWILVKAISDWADGKKRRNKKARQELAASNAAKFILHVLQKVGIQKATNRKRVDLLLEGEFSELTPTRQADLVNILAAMLSIKQEEIRVLSVQRGSIRIELEMPEAAANYLYLIFDQNKIDLGDFRPLALSVEGFEKKIIIKQNVSVQEEAKTLKGIVGLYASDSKVKRVKADHQIRELANNLDLKELMEIFQNPRSSLEEKTVAAMAIGYHQAADKAELRVLLEALQDAVGEPAKYAYRLLSAIRKLIARDISLEDISEFSNILEHYKVTGGSDTSAVAKQIIGLMHRKEISETGDVVKVFLVYGHDETLLSQTARFLEKLGLEVILLREQPGQGQTIIEKLEHNSDVKFAVVLLTPDDLGKSVRGTELRPRARQNVIFELGYFIGKLGRQNVSILYRESVELPSDYFGIEYIKIDVENAWHFRLAKELRVAGLPVDLNKFVA